MRNGFSAGQLPNQPLHDDHVLLALSHLGIMYPADVACVSLLSTFTSYSSSRLFTPLKYHSQGKTNHY